MGNDQTNNQRGAGTYEHSDPVVDKALDWFMRLQDDHSSDTLKAFERWMETNAAGGRAYDDLVRMSVMPSLKAATIADRKKLEPIHCRRGGSPRQSVSAWKLGGLGALTLLMVGFIWLQLPTLMLRWNADYVTLAGERQTVQLPDGSTVVLNTKTAIAIDFADGRRRVRLLDGEAFFDVKHDPAHPFVVAGEFADVEVKGTAFGVHADRGEETVILERGRVDVMAASAKGGNATLRPDQMVVATKDGLSDVTAADPSQSLAWREGRVVFRDRAFSKALSDLQRYYSGSVFVMTDRVANTLVSGNYRVDDPEAAILTLAASAGASVTRLPGAILILR